MRKKKKDIDTVPQFVGLRGQFQDFGLANPMGSYTGVPIPEDDMPVQDADDL